MEFWGFRVRAGRCGRAALLYTGILEGFGRRLVWLGYFGTVPGVGRALVLV
jgi:hypothetical protein